jgi:hypothetical protein
MVEIFDAAHPDSSFELRICESKDGWMAIVTDRYRGEGKNIEEAISTARQVLKQYVADKIANKQTELDSLRRAIGS